MFERILNSGITSDIGNATLIVLVSTHPDVTFITPGISPGILSDVVIFFNCTIVECIVTDENERMIDIC